MIRGLMTDDECAIVEPFLTAPSLRGGRPLAGDSNEGGHLFQSDRGHHSNLMAASLVSSRGPVLVMSRRRSPGQVFAQGLD